MGQQYLQFYPEVVKKLETFKTGAIFWWCYEPSWSVQQLRARPTVNLKGFWKPESQTTEKWCLKQKCQLNCNSTDFLRQWHHVQTLKTKTPINSWHHHIIPNTIKEARLPAFQPAESLWEKLKEWLEIAGEEKPWASAIPSTGRQKAVSSAAVNGGYSEPLLHSLPQAKDITSTAKLQGFFLVRRQLLDAPAEAYAANASRSAQSLLTFWFVTSGPCLALTNFPAGATDPTQP